MFRAYYLNGFYYLKPTQCRLSPLRQLQLILTIKSFSQGQGGWLGGFVSPGPFWPLFIKAQSSLSCFLSLPCCHFPFVSHWELNVFFLQMELYCICKASVFENCLGDQHFTKCYKTQHPLWRKLHCRGNILSHFDYQQISSIYFHWHVINLDVGTKKKR